jgi:hypothetical protein
VLTAVESEDKGIFLANVVLNHICVSCEQGVDNRASFCGELVPDGSKSNLIHPKNPFFHRKKDVIHRFIPLGITSSFT